MSEAPERIWIDDEPYECHWWDFKPSESVSIIGEYIRTDLVQSQIDAAVAAERDACAKLLDARAKGCQKVLYADALGQCEGAAEDIRARGNTDALAKRDAQIRAEALREAAEAVGHFWGKVQVTKPEDILALIPEKEKDDE